MLLHVRLIYITLLRKISNLGKLSASLEQHYSKHKETPLHCALNATRVGAQKNDKLTEINSLTLREQRQWLTSPTLVHYQDVDCHAFHEATNHQNLHKV